MSNLHVHIMQVVVMWLKWKCHGRDSLVLARGSWCCAGDAFAFLFVDTIGRNG
jgi:hypothetical protein